MSIEFRCPACQQKYTAPDSSAGKVTRCKKCSATVTIPALEVGWEELTPIGPADPDNLFDGSYALQPLEPTPLQPLAPSPAPSPAPLAATSKKKRSSAGESSGRMAGLSTVLIVLGIVLLIIGNRERRLGALAKSTPQQMTLAQLAAHGPGDNIYLDLTDFRLLLEHSVIETQQRGLGKEYWTYAWIPAVAASQAGVMAPDNVQVLIGTGKCGSEMQLENLALRTSLRGIIVNETDKLNSQERKLLGEGLPSVNIASCYLFREGQGPGSATARILLLGGGAVALLAGLGIAAYRLRSKFAPAS